MPSRNIVRNYAPNTYYHVYNRGVNKQAIFIDDEDYAVFLNLLKRYVDAKPHKDPKGREYDWLNGKIDLLAYCLQPNHFHLFAYLHEAESLTLLLRGVATAYTGYFNRKYHRVGPLFQGKFKASRIDEEAYLLHISRYIHLNPPDYKNYQWSSLPYYLGNKSAAWLKPQTILDLFSGDDYRLFLDDYKSNKKDLDKLAGYLADS